MIKVGLHFRASFLLFSNENKPNYRGMKMKTLLFTTVLSVLIFVLFSNFSSGDSGCIKNHHQVCVEDRLYWQDSCLQFGDFIEECRYGCNADSSTCETLYADCAPNTFKACTGGNVRWYDSCGNPGKIVEKCTDGDNFCVEGAFGEAKCESDSLLPLG
jgi:hypothetical protein